MSRNGKSPKLDLKLNISAPRRGRSVSMNRQQEQGGHESPNGSSSAMTSPASSCVSSENNSSNEMNSPEAKSIILIGCPRCLMYVMVSDEENPKCPKCNSTSLVDFLPKNKRNN